MTSRTDPALLNDDDLQQVYSVTAFALETKITSDEQLRLLSLLGAFATKQELLMNVRLKTKVR